MVLVLTVLLRFEPTSKCLLMLLKIQAVDCLTCKISFEANWRLNHVEKLKLSHYISLTCKRFQHLMRNNSQIMSEQLQKVTCITICACSYIFGIWSRWKCWELLACRPFAFSQNPCCSKIQPFGRKARRRSRERSLSLASVRFWNISSKERHPNNRFYSSLPVFFAPYSCFSLLGQTFSLMAYVATLFFPHSHLQHPLPSDGIT